MERDRQAVNRNARSNRRKDRKWNVKPKLQKKRSRQRCCGRGWKLRGLPSQSRPILSSSRWPRFTAEWWRLRPLDIVDQRPKCGQCNAPDGFEMPNGEGQAPDGVKFRCL